MKLIKFACHTTIDMLYKLIFGSQLELIYLDSDPTFADWRIFISWPTRVSCPESVVGAYDAIILDDLRAVNLFKRSGIKACHKIYHNHGFYGNSNERHQMRAEFNQCPAVFADGTLLRDAATWMDIGPYCLSGKAVPDERFAFSNERNGRAMTIRTELIGRINMYPGKERAHETLSLAYKKLAHRYDIYGYNHSEVPIVYRRGYNPSVAETRYYSVHLVPETTPICHYALLETMALGVYPVFVSARDDLPVEEEGYSYSIIKDPGEAVQMVWSLMQDHDLSVKSGIRTQEMARRRFSFVSFADIICGFVEGVVGGRL